MGEKAQGAVPDHSAASPTQSSLLQHQAGPADEHGRPPGSPSRVGTGTTAPSADPERVSAANTRKHLVSDPDTPPGASARPAEPEDRPRQKYALAFPGGFDGRPDFVEVSITGRTGAGGHPVYEDASGIIQAEISDRSEVRILATGARQEPAQGVTAHPVV